MPDAGCHTISLVFNRGTLTRNQSVNKRGERKCDGAKGIRGSGVDREIAGRLNRRKIPGIGSRNRAVDRRTGHREQSCLQPLSPLPHQIKGHQIKGHEYYRFRFLANPLLNQSMYIQNSNLIASRLLSIDRTERTISWDLHL